MDSLQLKLVGAFDVLAGRFDSIDESTITSYYLHWRYFYDPPELMTLLTKEDQSSFHFGYYRYYMTILARVRLYSYGWRSHLYSRLNNNCIVTKCTYVR